MKSLEQGRSFTASKVRATASCDSCGADRVIFSDNAVGIKKGPRKNHGLAINQHGRIYRNGSALSFEQKVAVGVEYLKAKNDANGTRPNISALSKKCNVSRSTVTKVEEELISFGQVIDPKDIVGNRDIPSGPVSKSFSDLDVLVVLLLYHQYNQAGP